MGFNVKGYDIKQIINTSKQLVQSNANESSLDLFLKHKHTQNELVSLLLIQRIGLITKEQTIKLNQLKNKYMQKINESDTKTDDSMDIETANEQNTDFDLIKIESYLQKKKKKKKKKHASLTPIKKKKKKKKK